MESERPFNAITFGRIMLRLLPTISGRTAGGVVLEKYTDGFKLNVSSSLSLLELRTGIVSRLPCGEIGAFIKNHIYLGGIGDDFLLYNESHDVHLGVYYYENGAHPGKPCVVYNGKHSSISNITLEKVPESAHTSAYVFHTSNISLVLSQQTREVTLELIRHFHTGRAKISFDMNYCANLWKESKAWRIIESILPYINTLLVSPETSRRVFQKTGELHGIMKSYCQDYGVEVVATTNRQITSPERHTFGSILYSTKKNRLYEEEPYADVEVVDRIGSGDVYVAGVLFGLPKYGDHQRTLELGNASSTVKSMVSGDMSASDFYDIGCLIEKYQNKGLQSRMSR